LSLEWKLFSVAGRHGVAEESERAGSGNRGIELTQTPGGGVARIRENGITGPGTSLVHLLEPVEREIDLAANFDPPAGSALVQTERDITHRAKVQCDVLADRSISARGTHDENLILIGERHRDAVDLQLRGVSRPRDIVARHADQPLFPRPQLLVIEGVAEREHRPNVLMLGELALGLGADSEGRRVGGEALRKIPFDLLELAKQLVVFGVRDSRTVQDVVLVRSAG